MGRAGDDMSHEREVVSTHRFMTGWVTIYYVKYFGGAECYEYGVDLWFDGIPPLFIPMTEEGYGDTTTAIIDGCIDIMSHIIAPMDADDRQA